jgi:N-acyl-D-amino-acid deacylase
MLDYWIRNVQIVDGTGAPSFVGDIGLAAGRISALGEIAGEPAAARVLDGSGLVAAPGFIDLHSHTDLAYFRQPAPEAKIRQGITTELLAQDGLSVAPVRSEDRELLSELTAGLLGKLPLERWTWRSFEDYLQALARTGLPNNAAVLIPHGPVRILAMGMDNRPATAQELERMGHMVGEAMDSGAFGLSTGLIYPPCSYAPTAELVALNREVAARDGLFVVHQRDEGYQIQRAFAEVLQVARESGVHLHVSHLQAYGRASWPIIDRVLEEADAFLRRGGRVSWDRYPYLAGCTVLSAVLPPWTLAQGTKALVSNLLVPEFRARIRQDFAKGLDVWNNRAISVGWDKIVVSGVASEKNRWMEGRDCADLAQALGKDPIDFVCDLLAGENLAVTMISFYGSESVLEKVLSHPQATVASDGIFSGRPHPRLYGTYPRFLRLFVRETKRFSLLQAVHKITGFPAQVLGLKERGVLREGFWADLVLFDLDRITDRASYEQPEQAPDGIPYLFVNGQLVVDQGAYTGSLPGTVLRRGSS